MSVTSEILRGELGDLYSELQSVRRDLAWMQGQLERIRVLNESAPVPAVIAGAERDAAVPALVP